jgi:hypothetical protein
MITNLKIEHFKSIKSLNMDCNRINIFIGEPNTGKSNILEALALFTFTDQLWISSSKLSSYIRFKDLSNLFTDGILDHSVNLEIRMQDSSKQITMEGKTLENVETITITPKAESYELSDKVIVGNQTFNKANLTFRFSGESGGGGGNLTPLSAIKYYSYQEFSEYNDLTTDALKPPFGENLVALIQAHKPFRKKVSDILKAEGYRLLIKPHGKQIEIIKDGYSPILATKPRVQVA